MNDYKLLLLLILVGFGMVLHLGIDFGQKLDRELNQTENLVKQTHELSQQNHQLSTQIAQEQAALRESNDQQTTFLQCLLSAQNLGAAVIGCQSPVPVTKIITQQPSQSSPPPQNNPKPTPTPQPQPKNQGTLQKLLKSLGL